MTTIQDRIEILKNIFFANRVKCDNEQFLIEDINNLIKEVQEETRKEVYEECKQKMAQSNEWWNKKFLSITNKEK